MIRIWFNHWFSTAYRLIELMKQDSKEEIYVIGTNRRSHSVIQKVCDEWYEEKSLDGDEYIDYCLKFCKDHDINVFVPRKHMDIISLNKSKFEEIGVKVLVDDYKTVSLLSDKAKAYKLLSECKSLKIPDFYIVNTAEEFAEAYTTLKENHGRVCIKFVKDEGAMSFRHIVEYADRFEKLRMYQGTGISYNDLYITLSQKESFDDLMVMPFLDGFEVSVDCLKTSSGIIAIPRIKSDSRHEYIKFDENIISMAKEAVKKAGLEYPCNVQFRYSSDTLYLLEINTRMSGGLQMSCLAANVNVPNIALNKLLGNDIEWKMDKTDRIVSYIEIPQIVN